MTETTIAPNNKTITFGVKPQKERPVPWSADSITSHNHSLKAGSGMAGKAASQANAILRSGAPEGVALATAFKHVNKLRKAGRISEKQGKKLGAKYGDTGNEIDASSR